MARVLRHVGAVIAGLALGVAAIAAIEAVSASFYPVPLGIDAGNTDAMKAFIKGLPAGAFLFVLAGWAVGSFAGCWLAARLGPERRPVDGYVTGGLLLGASIVNMLALPHPLWFWLVALIVPPLAGIAAARLASRPPPHGGAIS